MSVPPIFELADEREYADRSHCLARVAMPGTITSALADRVEAWLGVAMTKAKVRPVPETDLHCATLPPFRRFACNADTESGALMALRNELEAWAKGELVTGHALPTWESAVPEVTPAAKSLVRLSNLRHELRTRAAEWGGERQNLPAGAVERCLADIDALVTRHAMQINGSPPPPAEITPPEIKTLRPA